MANHKKPENEKVDAVAGCVHKGTKGILQNVAANQGVSMSSLIGSILDEWAKGREVAYKDDRQLELKLK